METTITSNINEVIKSFDNFSSQVKEQVIIETLNQFGEEGQLKARINAPKDTGALSDNITFQIFQNMNKCVIKSIVHKPFPYNLWVNQEPGPYQEIKLVPPFSGTNKVIKSKYKIYPELKWSPSRTPFFTIMVNEMTPRVDEILTEKMNEVTNNFNRR